MAKPITIYDVARLAGVAPSTVSRTFSRPGRVSSVTAERIRQVAEQVGYRANPIARALSTSRTRMIALTVSDIGNPYFHEIAQGAAAAAFEVGYTLLLSDVHESNNQERQSLDRALPVVDGIVMAGSRVPDTAIRMAVRQRPVVVLNRVISDVPSIVSDQAMGSRAAMVHLVEQGHRTITYLAGPEASWADGMRWRAVLEVGHELGVKVSKLGPFVPTLAGGAQAAHELMRSTCSAAIAYNDQMAIGVIRGVSQLGGSVPGDLSVVGFDDIFAADLIQPRLTTVAAPLRDMGAAAVDTLLRLISGERRVFERPMVLPTSLILRDSTAQPSRKSTSPA